MSALAVFDSGVARTNSVAERRGDERPHLYLVPPTSAVAPARPATPRGTQLTERGLLAVLTVFAVLALASVAVIVSSFLSVSDAPVVAPGSAQVASGVQQ